MTEDVIEEWRQAERAAEQAEKVAQTALATHAPDASKLAATARALRKDADVLWRQCLGSSFTPLVPVPPSIRSSARPTDPAALNVPIDEWRRAQARAHAAEVKAVQAYTHFVEGAEETPALSSKAEAALLRQTAAERLERVYQVARLLRVT